ncbi:MAG: DNA polymerase III subunit beta [Rudaea sp.]|nr:DNA polymerase III subunit beta [Rudaea sp.]
MMRVEVEGKDLAEALRGGVQAGRSTLPVLECALLETGDGILRIHGTDLEGHSITEIPAKVIDAGAICANAALLTAAARNGTLKLRVDDEAHVLRAEPHGGSRLRVPTLAAPEFPIPETEVWHPLEIDPVQFAAAIRTVSYASGKQDVRYYLNGVALLQGYVCASDGHRAAMYRLAYDGPRIIIPNDQVDAVLKLLDDKAVLAYVDGTSKGHARKLRVKNGARTFATLLIDAPGYPDVQAIFPLTSTLDKKYTFDSAKLADAAKQFIPFCKQKDSKNAPALVLSIADGAAQFTDTRRTNVENCSWVLGEFSQNGEIGVAATYLIPPLHAVGAEKVSVYFTHTMLLITPVNDDSCQQHVIMGVRL